MRLTSDLPRPPRSSPPAAALSAARSAEGPRWRPLALLLALGCGDAFLGDLPASAGVAGAAGAAGVAGVSGASGQGAAGSSGSSGQGGAGSSGASGQGAAGQAGAGAPGGSGQVGGGSAGGGAGSSGADGGMAGGGMAGGGMAGGGLAGGGMAGGGVAGAQGGSGQDVCAPLAVGASWELGAKVPEQATLQPQVIAASGGVLLLGRPMRLWRVEGADFTLLGGEAPGAMKGSGISAAVVHDPVRNELVLFGNEPLSGALGDTWTLSLADLQWTQRCADCGVPPWKLGMARDAARDRIVLVSRSSTSVTSVSTSEWDGTSWARVCGEGAEPCAPGVVQAGSMAYDAARGVSVLVVFASATGPQTWEYDGAQPVAARWQQRSAPPEGLSGELRYDEARQRVTMAASKNSLEWDGDCWYYAHDPADALDASLAGLAHDPASNRTLAVGYSQAYGYFLATRADL